MQFDKLNGTPIDLASAKIIYDFIGQTRFARYTERVETGYIVSYSTADRLVSEDGRDWATVSKDSSYGGAHYYSYRDYVGLNVIVTPREFDRKELVYYFWKANVDNDFDLSTPPNRGLPRDALIHFIWIDGQVTPAILENMETTIKLHPGYRCYLWTNVSQPLLLGHKTVETRTVGEITETSSQYGLDPELFDSRADWDRIIRVDFLRLLILVKYGGVYLDANDCYALGNLTPYLNYAGQRLLLVHDFYPYSSRVYPFEIDPSCWNNYFIYCSRNHPQLRDILSTMAGQIPGLLASINGFESQVRDQLPGFAERLQQGIANREINSEIDRCCLEIVKHRCPGLRRVRRRRRAFVQLTGELTIDTEESIWSHVINTFQRKIYTSTNLGLYLTHNPDVIGDNKPLTLHYGYGRFQNEMSVIVHSYQGQLYNSRSEKSGTDA